MAGKSECTIKLQPQTIEEWSPEPSQICANCKWFHKDFIIPVTGFCRRYAPGKYEQQETPSVLVDHTCGDWEESDLLRVATERVAGSGPLYFYVRGRERTQSFDQLASLYEAEANETLEWRIMENPRAGR